MVKSSDELLAEILAEPWIQEDVTYNKISSDEKRYLLLLLGS